MLRIRLADGQLAHIANTVALRALVSAEPQSAKPASGLSRETVRDGTDNLTGPDVTDKLKGLNC
jgi:hypothetical protein